jgi:hypothetical protein
MTLLQKLTKTLNNVDGNNLTAEDRGYDEYWCMLGKHRVYEDAYNHKYQCCYKCFYNETEAI